MDVLEQVFKEARDQALLGKGRERHGLGLPFEQQPIMLIMQLVGIQFSAGQAVKKVQEAMLLLEQGHAARAVAELLGAMVYLAAAVIHIRRRENPEEVLNDGFGAGSLARLSVVDGKGGGVLP